MVQANVLYHERSTHYADRERRANKKKNKKINMNQIEKVSKHK